ncbi:MAG: MFS transporter [Solirubrobacterales bacterium]|nr:MFS transporter [Solirubrobacterales bacterium]
MTSTTTFPRAARWAALPVLLSGTFMVVLDFFIVNVALPSMQLDLHASDGALEWVAAGYALTSAVFLLTAGRLGDRIGRRRAFSLGLGLFTASSAACGAASGPEMLIVARLLQGVAGALLMTNVLSIIGVLYDGEDRTRAMTAYGLSLGLAAVGGQLIGGVLVQADIAGLGWRSCFLINVPIGVVALVLAPRLIGESRMARVGGLDLAGSLLLTAGLTAILLPLVEGRQHGWPAWTWIRSRSARRCWRCSCCISGASPGVEAPRCSSSACFHSGRSPPASSPSSPSGADKRPSSSCSRFTSNRVEG